MQAHLAAGVRLAYNLAFLKLLEHKYARRGKQTLSFKPVLEELVSSVEGAEGAIFLEVDGEAVEWYAPGDGDRLRLRAAYIAVVLQASRALAKHLDIGTTRQMLLAYEGAKFIIEELGSGYFLVLEVSVSTNVAWARYRMQPAVASLRAEILA